MSEANNNPAALAEFVAKQTRMERSMAVLPTIVDPKKASLMLVPEGFKVENLDGMLPASPKRKVEHVKLTSLASFIAYVNEQKNESTRIFACLDKEPYTFRAIIDYHGVNGKPADWCEHDVVLTLAHSDQFKTWMKYNGEFMSQGDFAEFLKDNRMDIAFPDSASLATMVMRLDANVERNIRGKVQTNDGVMLSFEEKVSVTDGSGGTVRIPDRLGLSIPLFRGSSEIDLNADFKIRTSSGSGIAFGYRLLAMDSVLRTAIQSMSSRIESDTGVAVYQ